MAYSEILVERVRDAFAGMPTVEEKKMFGVLCFMVDGKMCVCVGQDEIMYRIGSDNLEAALQKEGTHAMMQNRRMMKGSVFVNEKAIQSQKDFDYWINLALEFNKSPQSAESKK